MEEPQLDPEEAEEDSILDDDELIEQYMAVMSCRTETPGQLDARVDWRKNRNKD